MAGKAGRSGGGNRRSNESHRATGTLRPDRHGASLAQRPATLVDSLNPSTEPSRMLGKAGRMFFDAAVVSCSWLGASDVESLTMCGELIDERQALRLSVFSNPRAGWRDRIALRKVDALVVDLLRELGMTPIARSRGALGEVAKVLEQRAQLHVLSDRASSGTKDIVVDAGGGVESDDAS